MDNETPKLRIRSIDLLRGIVMVLMALDHTRDYFTDFFYDPTDLAHASTAMFITRWITHYCAPVFIFLAGCSAYLSMGKGKSKKDISLLLLSRGIWLIILELTIIRFGWLFDMNFNEVFVQVIWAIGWSMVFLSLLVFLPKQVILLLGLIMIFSHNMLDGIHADSFGENAVWWNLLHEQGPVKLDAIKHFFVIYPLIPWVGVMCTGYCFGQLFRKNEAERNRWFYAIGFGAIILFIILRFTNAYGDPQPWQHQSAWWRTLLSFVNVNKYPPSLLYLLMTIGPAIAALPLLEKANNRVGRFFTVYGRVPMFYYILHIYLIHTIALIGAMTVGLPYTSFVGSESIFGPKANWGFSLPVVYFWWLVVVALLYYPCRWFMHIKMNHKKWWLSYI